MRVSEKSMKNLVNNAELTPEERSRRASNAGKASVEARRKKKMLKECMIALLESTVGKDPDGNDVSGAEAMANTAFRKALNGDLKAWELVRDTAGQKPAEKVIQADVDSSVIEEVEALVAEYDTESST